MSDNDSDEFTIDGETYYWGRKVGPADFGMVPTPPPGLELAWDRGSRELEWEITIGERKGRP